MVTPSVGSADALTSLTWIYLKSLELVILLLVILVSLIHPRELRTKICLSLRLPEDQIPPGSLLFVTNWRTLKMMIQIAEDFVCAGVS